MLTKLVSLSFFVTILSFQTLSGEVFKGPTALKNKSFDELTIMGPAKLENIKANKLTVQGPANFITLEISGKAEFRGPVNGEDAEFNDVIAKGPFKCVNFELNTLETSGPATIKEFTIHGNTVVRGPLTAEDGYFQDITAGSNWGGNSIELNDVTVRNITITKGTKPEVLTLIGDVEVLGDIVFESGRGSIVNKGDQVVIEGKVIGTLTEKNSRK